MNIIKTGTIDADIVEANPIVFNSRLYLFQYIRSNSTTHGYYGNTTDTSYFRFLDLAAGEYLPAFGQGLHMGNAFVHNGRVFVTAVEDWGKSRFYIMDSPDLIHWSAPHVILENPAWKGYNTSLCKAGDKFVMVFELGAPLDIVRNPFTMFFAESDDLKTFRQIPDAVFGQDFYTGAPMLRHHDGWFYFFYLDGNYERGFVTRTVRSRDLKQWQHSPATVLAPDAQDRIIAPGVSPQTPWKAGTVTADNINTSDMDMTEFQGNLELVYSWGNQHGVEFLARAQVKNTTEAEFCASFFE